MGYFSEKEIPHFIGGIYLNSVRLSPFRGGLNN
jgi:hypothetical protein